MVQRTANVVRKVLLAGTVVAATTLIVFSCAPELVNDAGAAATAAYRRPYEKELDAAVEALARDEQEGFRQLEAFVESVADVKKFDQLAPLKRRALAVLARESGGRGHAERALHWFDQRLVFDDSDVQALVDRAQLLLQMEGRAAEGEDVLASLYRRMPEVGLVAHAHATVLLSRGDLRKAFEVQHQLKERQPFSWKVLWDIGDGFSEKHAIDVRPTEEPSGAIELRLSPPPGAQRLRIDPPAELPLKLIRPVLVSGAGAKTATHDLWNADLELKNVSRADESLITAETADPSVALQLPQGFAGDVLALRVEEVQHVFRRGVFAPISTLADAEELARSMEEATAVAFHQAWIEHLGDTALSVYWMRGTEGFNATRKARAPIDGALVGEAYEFDVSLDVGDPATHLRLDFPEVEGRTYVLESIELGGAGNVTRIDPAGEAIRARSNIDSEGKRFRVAGPDPYVTIRLPDGERRVDTVRVRGSIL